MAYPSKPNLLFYFIWATLVLQGVSGDIFATRRGLHLQEIGNGWKWMNKIPWRRTTIGSVVPTCTFNECRGCKYKCTPKQVPVEGNDPIHSAYRYKCVCHRYGSKRGTSF